MNTSVLQFIAKAVMWLLRTISGNTPIVVGWHVRNARNEVIAALDALAHKAVVTDDCWEKQALSLAKARFRQAVAAEWWWRQLYRLIVIALLVANVWVFREMIELVGAEGTIHAVLVTAKTLVLTAIDWIGLAIANAQAFFNIA